MPMLVSIARVADVPTPTKMQEFHDEHERVLGAYADVPKILRDPNDPNQVAVVCDVRDLDGLRAATRTPEGDAMMRKYGFIEQLSYFLED
ncbi:MAG: hypothetical protein AB3N15_00145 [Paracoccaceae bacterium]